MMDVKNIQKVVAKTFKDLNIEIMEDQLVDLDTLGTVLSANILIEMISQEQAKAKASAKASTRKSNKKKDEDVEIPVVENEMSMSHEDIMIEGGIQ